jgi:hypothetical protein
MLDFQGPLQSRLCICHLEGARDMGVVWWLFQQGSTMFLYVEVPGVTAAQPDATPGARWV